MSRIGQCPSCRAVYEFEEGSVGTTIQCECEIVLLATEAAGFSEIPVACTQCDSEYVVDGAGVGETVDCKCGATLTVPGIVLCPPLQNPSEDAVAFLHEAKASSTATDDSSDAPVVLCPKCKREYAADVDDLNDVAVCKCGSRFQIAIDDGNIVAQVATVSKKENDRDDETVVRTKKPMSLASILGLAFVALLLLVSIVMFLYRNSGDGPENASKKTGGKETAASVSKENLGSLAGFSSQQERTAIRPIPDPGPSLIGDGTARTTDYRKAILVAAPAKPLPAAKPAREAVRVLPAVVQGLTFDRAYAEAFQSYTETNRLKEEGDNEAYELQLGEAIGMLQGTLSLAAAQPQAKQNELRYLLAYLYFSGGHLIEASVMGEAVARWGDVKEKSTREAGMIALAAAQEANETQWGLAENPAELGRMRSIANVIAKRWPKDKQLDVIWLNIGQRYEAYNDNRSAAQAFAMVSEQSAEYANARLAAGSALWNEYRGQAAVGEKPTAMLEKARKYLADGVDRIATSGKPTLPLMAAKLSLSRIEIIQGDFPKAESWLVDQPMPLISSVTTKKPGESQIKVTESLAKMAFETLFLIRSQRRDPLGAVESLKMLAASLPEGKTDVGKLLLSVVKDNLNQLLASPVVTREQFSTLSDLIEPLKDYDANLTAANVLWLGESWSKLADRAATPELAKQCFTKAESAFELAIDRPDFPNASLQSATLRRAQLLRNAGRVGESIPLLEKLLSETPNAFGLQIEAAEAVQQAAIEADQAMELLSAIDGPKSSAIWGWAKLVTTLHRSESDRDRDRLLMCQYKLAQCKWMIASATPAGEQKQSQIADLRRLLERLLATTSADREPWYGKLQELQQLVAQ